MTQGKITFISVPGTAAGSFPWRATSAVAEADFIWATSEAPPDLLRHAAQHADIILEPEEPPVHSVLPFYGLASGGGFRVTQIYSRAILIEEVREHIDRCRELGLAFEIVQCQ